MSMLDETNPSVKTFNLLLESAQISLNVLFADVSIHDHPAASDLHSLHLVLLCGQLLLQPTDHLLQLLPLSGGRRRLLLPP